MPIGDTTPGDDDDDENGNDDGVDEGGDSPDVSEEKIEELLERTERLVELAESEPEMEMDISDVVEDELNVLSVRQKGIEERMDSLESELGEFQSRLEKLLFGPEGAPRDELDDEESNDDLWDVGDNKPSVNSIGEYKRVRSRASDDTSTVSPYFSNEFDGVDSERDRMVTYFDLYRSHYASLEEIFEIKATGDEWDVFVRELVNYYGVTREAVESDVENVPINSGIFLPLVDVIDPSPSYFGIFSHGGELTVEIDECPIPFLTAYDDYYFADTNYDLATDVVNIASEGAPWTEMEVDEPSSFDIVQGMDYRSFNFNAFATITSSDKYDVPKWLEDSMGGRDFGDN